MNAPHRPFALALGLLCYFGAVVCVALGSAVAAAESTAAPPAQVRLDLYRGKWTEDERFQERFGGLPALVQDSLGVVKERLGLEPTDASTIHVYVVDASVGKWGLDRARSWSRTRGTDATHLVALFAEYYLSGDSNLDRTVVHELTHAVMRERMGQARYERLPYWVREGLAVYVAEEGEHHLRRNLQVAEDVDALVTGLMTESRTLIMYPYAWLAIDLLEKQGGEGSVSRFARALVAGADVKAEIEAITQWSFEEFETKLREHVTSRVRAEADGLDLVRAAKSHYLRRRYLEARAGFDAFLKAHPDSCFAPTARYYGARTLYLTGRHAEARDLFQECVERDMGRSGLSDEAQLYLAICSYVLGDTLNSVTHLRRYVHLHPQSNELDLGFLYLGRALVRLGRIEDAREALKAVPQARGARERNKRTAARELEALSGA